MENVVLFSRIFQPQLQLLNGPVEPDFGFLLLLVHGTDVTFLVHIVGVEGFIPEI